MGFCEECQRAVFSLDRKNSFASGSTSGSCARRIASSTVAEANTAALRYLNTKRAMSA